MVKLQVACPASFTVNRSKGAIDLTFEASLQFLHSPIMDDDPAALRADELFDVIKLRFTNPLTKLPRRNSARVTEGAQAERNVGEEKQRGLQPKELGNADYIQLCTVCEQANGADRVDEEKGD